MCRDNMTRCITFVLYALLQWCSAEITNSSPESWYNANVINDATYTPKPLMDLFSTDQTFTTQQPTYSSINPEFSSINPDFYSQDPTLSSQAPTLYSQDPTYSSQDPTFSSLDPNFSSQDPSKFSSPYPTTPYPTTPYPTTPYSNYPTTTTQSPTFQPGNPTFSTANPIVVLPGSTQSSQSFTTTTQSTSSQGTTFDPFSTVSPSSTTGQNPQNLPGGNQGQNYFVFFQNERGQSSTPTASTDTVNITPFQNTRVPFTSTAAPRNSTARIPFIKFRIVSPAGSITNVNLNPQTTTRRPTTTRRNRRRNRNTYEDCIDACGGRRSPICASPLSSRPIDSDNLKGFPSICHMACHNSFKKQPYEKVIDGRCGRLRTRIRPLDANKLRRDELNRAQYTVVQNPAAIIEFQPMPSK